MGRPLPNTLAEVEVSPMPVQPQLPVWIGPLDLPQQADSSFTDCEATVELDPQLFVGASASLCTVEEVTRSVAGAKVYEFKPQVARRSQATPR